MRKPLAATALLTLAGVLLVGCHGGGANPVPSSTVMRVGLAYDVGDGGPAFHEAAVAGLERAGQTIAFDTHELSGTPDEPQPDKYNRLMSLCRGGDNPVIVIGAAYATALGRAATDCPDVTFAIVDATVAAPNVTSLVFAAEQGSFLMGVAAALKTTTRHVGFLGGCRDAAGQQYEAGYVAGARAVDQGIQVEIDYLATPPQCEGARDAEQGRTTAERMYDNGADIVYQSADGTGAFEAAAAKGKLAIGAGADHYLVAEQELRSVIMTSMVKHVDVAVFDFIDEYDQGNVAAGIQMFDLERDGVGYATSGGYIDDIVGQLDDYRARIIDGAIVVPVTPG